MWYGGVTFDAGLTDVNVMTGDADVHDVVM